MDYMEQQMQQLMESGEHEFNELMEKLNPPADWDQPKWFEYERVHGWRNYVNEELQAEWPTFTGRQKIILSSNFDDLAGRENWD
jgi:hypothetical protein